MFQFMKIYDSEEDTATAIWLSSSTAYCIKGAIKDLNNPSQESPHLLFSGCQTPQVSWSRSTGLVPAKGTMACEAQDERSGLNWRSPMMLCSRP